MANCYSNSNISGNYSVVSGASCVSPNDFDKLCDYTSNKPFAKLPGPTADSKIKTYWKRGDVTYPLKCILTWNEYISYQKIPVGTKLGTTSNTKFVENGAKGNGLNNPINLSYGDIAKMYGSTGSKTMSDGQKNAVFRDITDGLAAAMHFIKKSYHGQNVCQLNNRHQGYYTKDGSVMRDCYGMAALRLRWVTNNCNSLGMKPNEQLDLNDKYTLFTLTNSISKQENGMTFGIFQLNRAYDNFIKNFK